MIDMLSSRPVANSGVVASIGGHVRPRRSSFGRVSLIKSSSAADAARGFVSAVMAAFGAVPVRVQQMANSQFDDPAPAVRRRKRGEAGLIDPRVEQSGEESLRVGD